jgi:hypothetical protein
MNMEAIRNHPKRKAILVAAVAAAAAMVFATFASTQAKAQWSGCGIGAQAAWAVAQLDTGTPIGISSEGLVPSAIVNCDAKLGDSPLVVGVFASYGYALGDLKTIGANTDLSVGGRAGVALGNAMPFLSASWSRIDTDGGNTDGFKVGLGLEVTLPGAPGWSMAGIVERGMYDDFLGSGLDVNTTSATLRLSYKFFQKAPLSIFDDAPAPCDPKFANCKAKKIKP